MLAETCVKVFLNKDNPDKHTVHLLKNGGKKTDYLSKRHFKPFLHSR